jgi:hypothetical protein
VTYESITHEMIQALSDEIEAIKEGGGGRGRYPFRTAEKSVSPQVGFCTSSTWLLNWRCLTTRPLN